MHGGPDDGTTYDVPDYVSHICVAVPGVVTSIEGVLTLCGETYEAEMTYPQMEQRELPIHVRHDGALIAPLARVTKGGLPIRVPFLAYSCASVLDDRTGGR